MLDGIFFAIQPGEFIAIVGPSGSAKSTLLRLMQGFEQLERDEIFYDGKPLGELNLEALRGQMGVVLQNSRSVASGSYAALLAQKNELARSQLV